MNFRSVPPASFESPEAVEAFVTHFEDSVPSRGLTSIAFPLMAALLPRTAYDLGAPQEITEHLEGGGQIYLMPDHKERLDIPVHTGAVYRSRALHSVLRALDIESQPENFDVHPQVSILLRELGADGVARKEDLRSKRFKTPPDRVDEFMAVAMPLQMAISAKHINAGRQHATYWPGGRRGKKGRPLERFVPDDVKDGVVDRLDDIDDPDNVRLVFVGTDYSNALVLRLGVDLTFGVNVAFSRPYAIPEGKEEKKILIATEAQKCDDAAARMARNLPPGPAVALLRSVVEDGPANAAMNAAQRIGRRLLSGTAEAA
jgi:hypothetical protein